MYSDSVESIYPSFREGVYHRHDPFKSRAADYVPANVLLTLQDLEQICHWLTASPNILRQLVTELNVNHINEFANHRIEYFYPMCFIRRALKTERCNPSMAEYDTF